MKIEKKAIKFQKGIQHLVRQLEWGREPAEDVRITLSQLQLQKGFLDPLLSCPTLTAQHIEPGWRSHIRQRLYDLNAHIEVEDAWTPLPQQANDQSLMEVFLQDATTERDE